jgi:PPOX class probable F420-dependent enzyme
MDNLDSSRSALTHPADARFISLTTYRRAGTAVATPVWTVADGPRLLVWTAADSGKAKRLRHTPSVTVAASDARGNAHGDAVPGNARLLPPEELTRVERLFAAKYRLAFPAMRTFARLRRRFQRPTPPPPVGIEITLN